MSADTEARQRLLASLAESIRLAIEGQYPLEDCGSVHGEAFEALDDLLALAGVGEARPAEPPQAEESLGSAAESAAQEYRVVYPGGSSTTGFTDEDEAVAWSQGFAGARVEWRTPWTALEEAR